MSQLEQELAQQADKNAEYRKKLRAVNNFIKKLALIVHCYRHRYNKEYCTGKLSKDSKNSRNRSALEYLCGEVYRITRRKYRQRPQHKVLPRAKSEELLPSGLECTQNSEIANIISAKESMENLPDFEEYQSNIMHKHASTDSMVSDICECCLSKFTWYKWRHHCRMCGKTVCQACSNHKGYVVGYSDKRVRICRECYMTKANTRRANQSTPKA